LLHEYLHALGYIEEPEVRRLVHDVSLEAFSPGHPATQMALSGPAVLFPEIISSDVPSGPSDVEVIPDLERNSQKYIS
jgi:hypothetical protein